VKTFWPPDVVERYRTHFDQMRSSVGEDLKAVLDHFGESPSRKAWLLLERIVTWSVYIEKPLSLPERMYAGTIAMRSDVANGGFHQYFVNDAGDYWEDVLFTLRAAGDMESERHFLRTIGIFPDARPSTDRAIRDAQLAAIEEQDEAAMNAHFERQDAEYYGWDYYPSDETLWLALHQVPNQPFIPCIEPGTR